MKVRHFCDGCDTEIYRRDMEYETTQPTITIRMYGKDNSFQGTYVYCRKCGPMLVNSAVASFVASDKMSRLEVTLNESA